MNSLISSLSSAKQLFPICYWALLLDDFCDFIVPGIFHASRGKPEILASVLKVVREGECADFGCDGVNFLHSC